MEEDKRPGLFVNGDVNSHIIIDRMENVKMTEKQLPLETNTADDGTSPDTLWQHEEDIKIKNKGTKDEINAWPLWTDGNPNITFLRKRINRLKNAYGVNKATFNRMAYEAGLDVLEAKLVEKGNTEIGTIAKLHHRLSQLSNKKEMVKSFAELWETVDGIDFTEDEFNDLCASEGIDPDRYKKQYSIQLSKSEVIRRWLHNKITDSDGYSIYDIRNMMVKDKVLESDKDEKTWNLAKNIASKLNCPRGEYGKWYPPIS